MKTSIETISGKLCTAIWHKPEYQNKLLGAFDIPQKYGYELGLGSTHIVTILPALPKHPKPDSKTPPRLLPYRYASEGIFIVGIYGDEDYETCGFRQFLEMYHNGKLKAIVGAVDADGNRVEVAIKGE